MGSTAQSGADAAPSPPPAGEPSPRVIELASANATSDGGPITEVSYAERPDDVSIEPRRWHDGAITCAGQVGHHHGSSWAGFGMNMDLSSGRQAIDATPFKSLTVWLSAKKTMYLRVALYGRDTRLRDSSCAPTRWVKIHPRTDWYELPFSSFEIDARCDALGPRSAQETLTELVGIQFVDATVTHQPSTFTVGEIQLSP